MFNEYIYDLFFFVRKSEIGFESFSKTDNGWIQIIG